MFRHLSALFTALALVACSEPAAIVIEPLRIVNWSPSHGAPCIAPDAAIFVTFSGEVEAGSLTGVLTLSDQDGEVSASISYDKSSHTAKITPAAPLSYDRVYAVTAGAGVRSPKLGNLPAPVTTTFRTVRRQGCTAGVQCRLPSDCPGTQICANVGVCMDECATDKDCFAGTCNAGTCVEL